MASALTHVATYRRRIGASIERVWENVRDWEHLPFLHRSSFRSIELQDAGAWGFRTRVGLHPNAEIVIELCIDAAASRYVARTTEGPGAPGEIRTALAPTAPDATDIEVEFWLPDVDPARADAIGRVYTQLYEKLWDEDESMMVRRTRELARAERRDPAPARVALGSERELRARLPLAVEWGNRLFRIADAGGELVVHAGACPHLLGPLDEGAIEDGVVTCPWHGWRFDIRSGKALDGRSACLPIPPRIEADSAGALWLVERRC